MESTQRIFLGGLPFSTAVAWEWSKALGSSEKTRALLCPDQSWVESLGSELESLRPDFKVFSLLPLETNLLRNLGPTLFSRMERVRFFSHAYNSLPINPSKAFLLSPEGLSSQSPVPAFWRKNLLLIQKDAELSRSDLQADLILKGYMPAELVEREGEYAVRGSIVDVFSPLYDHPVRLELFGDEVQSLRLFQVESQRTIEELAELYIPPVREFLFPDDLAPAKSVFRKIADSKDWERKDRDAVLERLDQRIYFSTIDYWASLIDPDNYPATNPIEIEVTDILEAPTVEREIVQAQVKIERDFLAAQSEGEWVPPAGHFLRSLNEVQDFSKKVLSRAQWLSLKTQTHHEAEPVEKKPSTIHSQDRLRDRLRAAREQKESLPLAALHEDVREKHSQGYTTILVGASTSQLERLLYLLQDAHLSFKIFANINEILRERPPLAAFVGDIGQGFVDAEEKLSFIVDEEILGSPRKRGRKAQRRQAVSQAFSADMSLLNLKPQDLVVHAEHGIGRYLGLKTFEVQGIFTELIEIEYRDSVKLLLPVTRLSLIQKYSAAGQESAQLDRMGGQSWESKKSKAKASLQNIAGELLHLYSERQMARGPEINPDMAAIDAFATSFSFVETPDQATAIETSLEDMRGPKPMDRLLCGDVGYGKTEVALRLAHAAVSVGYQVAVLVPTTLLSTQHEETFRRRLSPFNFKVKGISRFKSTKEVRETLKGIKDGTVDVLIGTHRLLGNDVAFKKLGLLVVDEEQKFGVTHKEKIKRFKNNIHILSMTATPIPRTLNMAMSGIKDLSIITTPPQDRLSVRTHVAKWKDALIVEAVENEIKRGGQVFFVHNRVLTIEKVLATLKKLLPHVQMEYVHGQMDETKLEECMTNFYEGRTQLLLTTSIIESGLDVPNANTLIVDRADTFGLAQLYQMRGRVGRSTQRAYAYFLIPKDRDIGADAEERLAVLSSYQELGSGFHIASHDLEIRGSGELLGREQSGHMAAIGFDTYLELLQECMAEIKGEKVESHIDPEVQLGLDTHLPEAYIPEVGLRLMFYRKLASASDEHEVDVVEKELCDRFGELPPTALNLVASMRIKCQLRRLGIKSLKAGKNGFSLFFDPSTPVKPEKLVESIRKYPAHFQMTPEGKLFLKVPEGKTGAENILRGVEGALTQLESWAS